MAVGVAAGGVLPFPGEQIPDALWVRGQVGIPQVAVLGRPVPAVPAVDADNAPVLGRRTVVDVVLAVAAGAHHGLFDFFLDHFFGGVGAGCAQNAGEFGDYGQPFFVIAVLCQHCGRFLLGGVVILNLPARRRLKLAHFRCSTPLYEIRAALPPSNYANMGRNVLLTASIWHKRQYDHTP